MMYEISPESQVTTLEDYVEAIRSRWFVVVGFALAGLLLGLIFAQSREDRFSASAAIVVNPTPVGSLDGSRLVAANLDREVRVLTSDFVASIAVETIGGDADPDDLRRRVDPVFVPGSDVIEVAIDDSDPMVAAAVVNGFAEAYVDSRNADQVAFYSERLGALEEALSNAEGEQTSISEQIGSLDSQREAILADTGLEAVVRQEVLSGIAESRQILVAERNGVAAQVRILANDITDIKTNRDSEAPAARLLSTALPPGSPAGIPGTAFIIAGTLAGLIGGAVVALLSARLDKSAGTVDAVVGALGVQVLGAIPRMGWRVQGAAAMIMLSSQKSVRAHHTRESYRRLRASVEFLMGSEEIKSLLVTSSRPGEGKSVTSANLAVALAAGGQKVALVNADMRRPSLEIAFGLPASESGLSAFLTGMTEHLELTAVDGAENLFLVPAGPQPRNPGELLASDRFELLVAGLIDQVDIVIVDTPPVGATADSMAASGAVGGVLVVVDAGTASQDELKDTRADLERSGANVLGAVLNRDKSRRNSLFSRRNKYAYAD